MVIWNHKTNLTLRVVTGVTHAELNEHIINLEKRLEEKLKRVREFVVQKNTLSSAVPDFSVHDVFNMEQSISDASSFQFIRSFDFEGAEDIVWAQKKIKEKNMAVNKVLDIGTYKGETTYFLSRIFDAEVDGIDINPFNIIIGNYLKKLLSTDTKKIDLINTVLFDMYAEFLKLDDVEFAMLYPARTSAGLYTYKKYAYSSRNLNEILNPNSSKIKDIITVSRVNLKHKDIYEMTAEELQKYDIIRDSSAIMWDPRRKEIWKKIIENLKPKQLFLSGVNTGGSLLGIHESPERVKFIDEVESEFKYLLDNLKIKYTIIEEIEKVDGIRYTGTFGIENRDS